MKEEYEVIFGKHAVLEALRLRPDVVKVLYIEEASAEVDALIAKRPILKKEFNAKKLPGGVSSTAVHQGYIAEIDASKLLRDYEEFMNACTITPDTAIAIMGEVQDPHNVGAVIRSAAAFGITAVIIPEHRQAQVTGTVIKVSVGTAFQVPLIQVGNVNNTIADLKKRGFWVYGLTGDAKQALGEEAFDAPSVIVLGNEGEGIRKKTLEHCDIPLRIPMSSRAESLNASVAAAVSFYAWSTKHPRSLK